MTADHLRPLVEHGALAAVSGQAALVVGSKIRFQKRSWAPFDADG